MTLDETSDESPSSPPCPRSPLHQLRKDSLLAVANLHSPVPFRIPIPVSQFRFSSLLQQKLRCQIHSSCWIILLDSVFSQARARPMAETLPSLRLLQLASCTLRPPSSLALSSCQRVQADALRLPRLAVSFATSTSCRRLKPLRAAASNDERPASRAV
jgi:hypothetical protein